MSSVFVTGLDSFTARHLVPMLRSRGHEVRGIVRDASAASDGAVGCDLLDYPRLAEIVDESRPERVIHLAGMTHADDDARATYDTNISGTRNLLRALAASSHPPAFTLLASSGAVYGRASVDPIDEAVPPKPESDYAVSKLAMEQMARLWGDRLAHAVVRPFNYTGVGQSTDFVIPKIVEHFRRQAAAIVLGNVDVERDFSDVRAVCSAYCGLIEAQPHGQVFNVCSGAARSLREVLRTMSEVAGYSIEVRSDPSFLRPNEVKRLRGDPGKLTRTLGDWKPIPFRTTLEWMYAADPEEG